MIKALIKKDLIVKFGPLLHPVKSYYNPNQRNKLFATVFSVSILIFYSFFIQKLFFGNLKELINNGLENIIIVSLTSVHTLLTLFIVIPSIMSTFYFSNDIKIMQTLPIKNRDIIISKFVSIFIDSIFLSIFLIVPTLVRMVYYQNQSILKSIFVILGILFTNILIITIMSAVMIYLMKWINRISNLKNKIQAFTLIFSIALWVLLSQYLNSQEDILNLIQTFDESIWSYVPQTFFLVKIFSNDILNSLIYLLIYCFIVFLLMYFTSKFLEKSLQKGIELNSITNNKSKNRNSKILIKKRSIVKEIAIKDFKEILKTPIYFFNIMSIGFLIIIFFGFGLYKSVSENGFALSKVFSLEYAFGEYLLFEILISISIGFLYTTSVCMNSSTLSSFTREGKNINFVKTLPTTSKEQVNGRLLASLWITAINLIFIIILVNLFIILSMGGSFANLYITISIIFGALISWFYFSNIDLYLGIKYPHFDWDTPQKAIKGGTNPFKSIIFTFSNAALIFLIYKILSVFTNNILKVITFTTVIFIILSAIFGFISYKINIKTLKDELPRYKDK